MRYAALVRALNVGGTGKLAMKDLIACCSAAGCSDVTTYIQSGNAVFTSRASEDKIKSALEKVLTAKMGAPIDLYVRTHEELAALVKKNPFAHAEGNRVVVVFLDEAPPKKELAVVGADGEELRAVGRDVFVHYPNGQGRSKLKLAFAKRGTARNMNTVTKLAALTAA